jgi:hypothetical protein
MMTWVYSQQLGGDCSSAASSWAEPRMPPSGFLISCARSRISSRLAAAESSVRAYAVDAQAPVVDRNSTATCRPIPPSATAIVCMMIDRQRPRPLWRDHRQASDDGRLAGLRRRTSRPSATRIDKAVRGKATARTVARG